MDPSTAIPPPGEPAPPRGGRGTLGTVSRRAAHRALAAAGLLLVALVITTNAWVSDDAYIVLRVVDNLVSGHGLRWNVAERVQVFTCPLWTLLLALPYSLTREAYLTTIAAGVVTSVAAAALILTRAARSARAAAFAAVALSTSKAFVDFSTSGLENPLSHLLLAALLILALRPDAGAAVPRRTLLLSLLGSLILLNRLDLALIVAPVLAWRTFRTPTPRNIAAAALGQAPIAAWLAFSLVYYGFFLPNTAYAKLSSDVAAHHLVERGLFYLRDSLAADPVTLGVIALGLGAGVVHAARTRSAAPAAAALGAAAYLVYTVRVGGDFMSGRFLAAPFVAALCILLLTVRTHPWVYRTGAAVAAAIGLAWSGGPLHVPTGWNRAQLYRDIHSARGIGDERAYYAQTLALAWLAYGQSPPDHPRFSEARDLARLAPDGGVIVGYAVGIAGYTCGPRYHIVDCYALADPLLARLRPYFRDRFRPGHLTRTVPPGYLETLAAGRNEIEDPDLAEYYRHLARITRAPLFSRGRWRSILDMQLGRLDHLVHHDLYREPVRQPWPGDLPLPWKDPFLPVPQGTRPAAASG